MKKHQFILVAVLTALVACNKPQHSSAPADVLAGRSARVSFSLSGGDATKALPVAANEVAIHTVDAFVFNSTADLDAYGHYTSSDFTTTAGVTTLNDDKKLECTTGAGKFVYIIINGNDSNLDAGEIAYASIKNEAELKARIFKLEDNKQGSPATLDNFQMIGRTTGLTFSAGDNNVNVEVVRPVARVVIKKITKKFSNAGLAAGTLKVKNIYMSDVVGKYSYGNIADGVYHFAQGESSVAAALPVAAWHNKYDPTADPKVVAIEAGYNLWLNRALAADVEFGANAVEPLAGVSKDSEIASTFYVMPNDVSWDAANPAAWASFGPIGGDAWSPRHTKLVVEVEYASKTYYYSIPIAENGNGATYKHLGAANDDGSLYQGIKANKSYEINELVLTRLGSTNPDEPTVDAYANFNISVQDWNVVLLGAEGVYEI